MLFIPSCMIAVALNVANESQDKMAQMLGQLPLQMNFREGAFNVEVHHLKDKVFIFAGY